MPPKKKVDREKIIQGALNLIKNGEVEISARKLAQICGCSVVPIYSEFENMEEVEFILTDKISFMLVSYPVEGVKGFDFMNVGLSYITFAHREKELFNWYFKKISYASDKNSSIVRRCMDKSMEALKNKDLFKSWSKEELTQLVQDLWVYAHGLATLMNTGIIPVMGREELINNLARVFKGLSPQKGD